MDEPIGPVFVHPVVSDLEFMRCAAPGARVLIFRHAREGAYWLYEGKVLRFHPGEAGMRPADYIEVDTSRQGRLSFALDSVYKIQVVGPPEVGQVEVG